MPKNSNRSWLEKLMWVAESMFFGFAFLIGLLWTALAIGSFVGCVLTLAGIIQDRHGMVANAILSMVISVPMIWAGEWVMRKSWGGFSAKQRWE